MLKLVIVTVLSLGGAAPQDKIETNRPVRHHAYRQLFAVPPIVVPGPSTVTLKAEEPRPRRRHAEPVGPKHHNVTTGPCNMPIIVGDASVDPGILISSKHHHEKPKMRIVEPKACGEKGR